LSVARSDFALLHPLRVRWAEVDRQGIVFNGHYLTYFDVGITEYWRTIGYPYPGALLEQGNDTFAVKATIEYKAPAQYDDLLDVMVRVGRIGRTSLQFVLQIDRGEAQLVSGELIYVIADAETRRPVPVPDFLRQAILRFERVPPAV
jgi:acyl-CoA thioester hydrolase